jgi:hypothetical protein
MNKALRLNIEARTDDFPSQRVVRLVIHDESVGEWTLGLCLLREQLVESLTIMSPLAALKLELQRLEQTNGRLRAVAGQTGDVLRMQVSDTELDYWLRFFLTYLRDGYGAVDHLDVETSELDKSAPPPTVVLKVQKSAAPLSRDGAIRRLGV